MTTEIDRDQLAAILDQIADYSAPADMGARIRIVTGALRTPGFVILNSPPDPPLNGCTICQAAADGPKLSDGSQAMYCPVHRQPDGIRKIGQDGMLSHETIRVRSDQ